MLSNVEELGVRSLSLMQAARQHSRSSYTRKCAAWRSRLEPQCSPLQKMWLQAAGMSRGSFAHVSLEQSIKLLQVRVSRRCVSGDEPLLMLAQDVALLAVVEGLSMSSLQSCLGRLGE